MQILLYPDLQLPILQELLKLQSQFRLVMSLLSLQLLLLQIMPQLMVLLIIKHQLH